MKSIWSRANDELVTESVGKMKAKSLQMFYKCGCAAGQKKCIKQIVGFMCIGVSRSQISEQGNFNVGIEREPTSNLVLVLRLCLDPATEGEYETTKKIPNTISKIFSSWQIILSKYFPVIFKSL